MTLDEVPGIKPFLRLYVAPPIVGKGRPRMNRRGSVYTPQKTKRFEDRVSQLALFALQAENRLGPTSLPVIVFGTVVHPLPKRYKTPPSRGWVAKGGHHYPDLDNVIKACLDGLNGVAYLDDSQVSGLRWTRVYAIEEEQPGIYLELFTVE